MTIVKSGKIKIKKLLSIILTIALSAAALQYTYAAGDAPEEGVFELAQVQADEAAESGEEFEGFIFKSGCYERNQHKSL